MNITATNGNIDSHIIDLCKSLCNSDYEHVLCGTNNREWYFVQASHLDNMHFSACTVWRLYYDTYIPNNPATTLKIVRSYEQDVYFSNPDNYQVYGTIPGYPALKERRLLTNAQVGKAFCMAFVITVVLAVVMQILRRYG